MGVSFGSAFPSQRELKERWVSFSILGVVLIALGILAMVLSQYTTLLSMMILGVMFIAAGVFVTYDAFASWWGKSQGFFVHFITGILYLILGILLLVRPMVSAISLTLLMAIFFIMIGTFRVILSPMLRYPRWGWSFLSGLITLILGIMILLQLPASGLMIIGLFVGVDLFMWGWTYLTLALFARAS